MKDSYKRSLVKTVSWRITGSLSTALIALLATGDLQIAGMIGASQVIANSLLYYIHERLWNKLNWGTR